MQSLIQSRHQSAIEQYQKFYKTIKSFSAKILSQRIKWNSYTQLISKPFMWKEQIGNYLMEFIKLLTEFNFTDMSPLQTIIQKIKEWFRNSIYEWQKVGQRGSGPAFSDWLSSVEKLIDQLLQQTSQLINQEKAKQESIILQKRIQLDQLKRKRKQDQQKQKEKEKEKEREREKRQRSRQKKFNDNSEDIQMRWGPNSIQRREREEDYREKNKGKQQMLFESQRNYLNQKLQRKNEECTKILKELSNQRNKMEFQRLEMKEKMQRKIQECGKLAQELSDQKVKNGSLESYIEELNRQFKTKENQIQRLKEQLYRGSAYNRNNYY